MPNVKATIPTITLNVNDRNIQIKSYRSAECIEKQDLPTYYL